MPINHAAVQVSRCYRTAAGEQRLVLGFDDDMVTYAVLFSAGGWTSQGPAERIDIARFLEQVEAEVARPPVTPPSWP